LKTGLLFAVLVIIAVQATAQFKVTATYEGRSFPDAEVCFYHVESADPRVGLLKPGLQCYPAGQVLDLPARTYGWFVRRGDRLITPHHGLITGVANPDGNILEREVALSPAAHLDLSGVVPGEGGHFSIIISATAEVRGATAPLAVVNGRALVPAETPIAVARIRNGVPVWVSETMRLRAGAVHVPAAAGGAAAIVWFRSDDPAPPPPAAGCRMPHSVDYLKLLAKQEVPEVELIDANGKVHRSATAAYEAAQMLDAMYVIAGASPGPAVIRVHGGRFLQSETRVELESGRPGIPAEGAELRLGSEVIVHVSEEQGLEPSRPQCDQSAAPAPQGREVVVWSCAQSFTNVKITPDLTQRCRRAGAEKLGGGPNAISFSGIPHGQALVTMTRAGHTTAMEPVLLSRGESSEVSLPPVELYVAGRVTRDGKPVAAIVRFQTGSAATDPNTGDYAALLSGPPGKGSVEVIACDDSFAYVHRPKIDVPPGPGFDLAVPPNELVVTVLDARSGKAIPDPQVTAAIVSATDKPDEVMFMLPGWRRDDVYVIDSLAEGTVARACADRQGYTSVCSPPVTIRKKAEHVTLRLAPVAHRGRVSAAGYSVFYWVRPDGTVAEQRAVGEDGRFTYDLTPTQEYAVLVGSAPLLVTRHFRMNGEGDCRSILRQCPSGSCRSPSPSRLHWTKR